ncbi:hypothetical protein ACH4VT_33595 [Streptomyces lydicus]|uniref:hypothetical protein n=1 Tax=Streptomyces lydicus TaxID=47763 RepID=UPI0037957B2B
MRPITPLAPEPPPDVLRALQTLKALLQGRGPHALAQLCRRTRFGRPEVRGHLAAMEQAGLCTSQMRGHWELTVPLGARSSWLTHGLPGAPPGAPAGDRDRLRDLHEATGHVVLLHSHLHLPTPVRLCVDSWRGHLDEAVTRQLDAHPSAAGRLLQAPLDEDAPGLVIQANLDSAIRPTSVRLQRIRDLGHALTDAPLPGWSLLSVPVYTGAVSLGLPETSGPRIAGALSLMAPTPDTDTTAQWLPALQHTARALANTPGMTGEHPARPHLRVAA